MENYFSYFSTETHVLGAKENRLIETVETALLSTANMFKLMVKKIITSAHA